MLWSPPGEHESYFDLETLRGQCDMWIAIEK
jgi:hypothetical protein